MNDDVAALLNLALGRLVRQVERLADIIQARFPEQQAPDPGPCYTLYDAEAHCDREDGRPDLFYPEMESPS